MTKEDLKPQTRKVRGWASYSGDEFTFKPSEEGTPSQLNVRSVKGAKVFTTTSETKPKRVAHLSCPADAADPFGEYVSQLLKLGVTPQAEQQLPEKQCLVSEGGITLFLNEKKGLLTYQGCIDLSKSANWQSELMRQLQVVVRTLPVNKTFVSTVKKLRNVSLSKNN